MVIEGNPKAEEFLSWVNVLHDQDVADKCRQLLLESNEDDFVPLTVLSAAREALCPTVHPNQDVLFEVE